LNNDTGFIKANTIASLPELSNSKQFRSMVVRGLIESISTDIVIDTGAAVSVISKQMYDGWFSSKPLIPWNHSHVYVADNRPIVVWDVVN
jgi:hypothetical protein